MLSATIEAQLRELRLSLDLEVAAGSCLALVGPSGAGKSSVLRAVAGLLRPRKGRIECDGETWLDRARGVELPPERRRCGYVFQDYALFGHMSVWRNVAYGLGLARGERRAAALELLERFGIAALADAAPATLSGGERQRVALARALASRPRALLLDEPLAALDARTRTTATRELAHLLSDAGVPAILVTHDFAEAITLADTVAVIEAGRIVQRGAPDQLAARPASAFVAEVTGSVVLAGSAVAAVGGGSEIRLDGGGLLASTDPAPAPGEPPPAAGHPEGSPVAVSVHPWEIALEAADSPVHGSQRNRLPGTVSSVATIGSRVRVGVDVGQPLVAEVTHSSRDALGLRPGAGVVAVWKASATRVVPR